jgi:8-oxo-dGTP pyrophosphatase MutT (NUDIX family)
MAEETIPYFDDKKNPTIPGKPVVERDMVYSIIVNMKTREVLCFHWQQFDWKVFIMGGIEEGEDLVETARREAEEETGYSNLRFMAEVGKTRASFYAANKGVNRISNATGILFELMSDEKKPVDEKEEKEHSINWIPFDKVPEFLNVENHKYIWTKALEHIQH